ncbi:MAG: outer membrane beta-barrel protein [Chitinophagales bacterium]|nr:outer membrane beta-barrel protein [Chitinophagales bacterium]MDW8427991.1 outer membrane beta-barrel protein [Chitinophagales bacterium]
MKVVTIRQAFAIALLAGLVSVRPLAAQTPDPYARMEQQLKRFEQAMQKMQEQLDQLQQSLDQYLSEQEDWTYFRWHDTAWRQWSRPRWDSLFRRLDEIRVKWKLSDSLHVDSFILEFPQWPYRDRPYRAWPRGRVESWNKDTTFIKLGPLEFLVIEPVEFIIRNEENGAEQIILKGNNAILIRSSKKTMKSSNEDDSEEGEFKASYYHNEYDPKQDKEKKDPRVRTQWLNFSVGFNNYITSAWQFRLPDNYRAMEPLPGASVGVHVHLVSQQLRLARPIYLRYGIYGEFNSYKFGGSDVLIPHIDSVAFASAETTLQKNKLSTDYLGIPLMVVFKTPPVGKQRLNFGVGGFGSYLIGSRTKIRNSAGERSKVHDSFNLNPVRYGVSASLGYGDVSLFGTYCLSPLFQKELEPKLYPVTVGLHFSF